MLNGRLFIEKREEMAELVAERERGEEGKGSELLEDPGTLGYPQECK